MTQAALSIDPGRRPGPAWHVVRTRSRCEQRVHDQLAAGGFEPFLPRIDTWSRRAGLRHRVRLPMFPGYVFLRHAMDKDSYIRARRARGLVDLLGEAWDRLAVVPDEEIEAVRRLADSGLPTLPYPYLRDGMRVRITRGPLADLEGILTQRRDDKGLLVLSVGLLGRSVALEVDCTVVVPA